MITVYILYSVTVDRYFIGRSSNPETKLQRHNQGKNHHTKTGIPWNLVYKESFEDLTEAKEKEIKLKSVESREELVSMIRSFTNEMG